MDQGVQLLKGRTGEGILMDYLAAFATTMIPRFKTGLRNEVIFAEHRSVFVEFT